MNVEATSVLAQTMMRSFVLQSRPSAPAAVLWGLVWCGTLAYGNEAKLAEIRTQGHFHAACVEQLQFRFHVSQSDGFEADAEFFQSGSHFRVNRADARGTVVAGKRLAPDSLISAFDGKRQQLLRDSESSLRLQDGNARATYAMTIPQTYAYAWLRKDEPLRWDTIVTSALWEERFADATYMGTDRDAEGRLLEMVEFPQRIGVKTPCIFRVWFAPGLGYLPVKLVRRVEETGAVASTMDVTRFKLFTVDGHTIAIPTVVKRQETGADNVSMKLAKTITLDEASLKVNEPIDPTLFTLDPSKVKEVYDIDRQTARLAKLEEEHRTHTPAAQPAAHWKWLIWCNVLLAVAVGLGLAYRLLSIGRRP